MKKILEVLIALLVLFPLVLIFKLYNRYLDFKYRH